MKSSFKAIITVFFILASTTSSFTMKKLIEEKASNVSTYGRTESLL
jgi:hypothetical protein